MDFNSTRGIGPAPSGRASDLTDAALLWTESLHGALPLRDALASVSAATAAASAMIYRWCVRTRRARIVATFTRDARDGVEPLQKPFGPDLIPVELHRARAGTVWRLEDARDDPARDAGLFRIQKDKRFADIVAIPLGQVGDQVDVLELCLDRSAASHLLVALADFARLLTFAWNRRPRGRIAQLLSVTPQGNRPLRTTNATPQTPLSVGNPWRLTPTEMRICHLIQQGHDPANLTALVGVADSTIRTHLRSIYAKSGVSGQVGLLRRLLSEADVRRA